MRISDLDPCSSSPRRQEVPATILTNTSSSQACVSGGWVCAQGFRARRCRFLRSTREIVASAVSALSDSLRQGHLQAPRPKSP